MNSKIDSNPNISLKHPELPKDVKKSISNTQNIIDHIELQWYFVELSSNTNISFQNILDHPELPWNWTAL
jgi:hypothetical protein